jgi:hypothetical protein
MVQRISLSSSSLSWDILEGGLVIEVWMGAVLVQQLLVTTGKLCVIVVAVGGGNIIAIIVCVCVLRETTWHNV